MHFLHWNWVAYIVAGVSLLFVVFLIFLFWRISRREQLRRDHRVTANLNYVRTAEREKQLLDVMYHRLYRAACENLISNVDSGGNIFPEVSPITASYLNRQNSVIVFLPNQNALHEKSLVFQFDLDLLREDLNKRIRVFCFQTQTEHYFSEEQFEEMMKSYEELIRKFSFFSFLAHARDLS
jgi:hypothetical protein